MSENTHYIILAVAGLVIYTSLYIKKIQRSFFSEPVLVMLIGLILNMLNLKVFQVKDVHSLLDIFSRLTIIVALISTALRVKHVFIMKEKRNLSVIIVAGMFGMWILSSVIFYLVFSRDLLFSMLLGAIITPTDPVVASSMVTGKLAKTLIPERVRSSLSFEAGANDGLAFPMVMLSFLLLTKSTGEALHEFVFKVLLWENAAAIVLAGVAGYFLGRLYHYFDEHHLMDKKAVIGYSLAVTLFIYALFEVIQANSIVSVFAAGVLFNSVVSENEDIREESVQEVFERLLVVPIFFLFGLIAPYSEWLTIGWMLVLFAIVILLFRRLPVLLLIKPVLKDYKLKDVLLMGWFGPVGVAAMFYSMHIDKKHHYPELWPIVSFVIFASTVVFGFTRYYISKWYHSANEKDKGNTA